MCLTSARRGASLLSGRLAQLTQAPVTQVPHFKDSSAPIMRSPGDSRYSLWASKTMPGELRFCCKSNKSKEPRPAVALSQLHHHSVAERRLEKGPRGIKEMPGN